MRPDFPPSWRHAGPAFRKFALLALTCAAALPSHAEISVLQGGNIPPALSPAYARWQGSLDAFALTDRQSQPAADGVLFIGSSTIRMWSHLSQDFRQVPVLINRGFGGSTMRDCNALVRELVIQYKPRQVMVYAGDNDLAEGRTPAEVLGSFENFVRSVRAELPGARISYISVKPSPARVLMLPKIKETNALIAGFAQSAVDVRYIDIFNPMLNAEGEPRPELFLADRLHLNEAGYRLWQSVLAADVSMAPPAPPVQSAQPASAMKQASASAR